MLSSIATALGLCITHSILAIISTIARIVARRRKQFVLALEDWVIIVATFFSVANAANVLAGAFVAGIGQHTPLDADGFPILGSNIIYLQIMTYVTQPVVTIAIGLARWSILLFYAKLFSVPKFKIPVRIMYGLNGAWTIAFALVFFFPCIPVDTVWTQPQGAQTGCVDVSVNLYFAVSSVILDVLVLCMPWPMIWRLQMPLAKKAAVLGMLMLGALIVAVSIGKTYAFFTVGAIIESNNDVLYDTAPLFYWTVPESCLSVVCANLPTLRPLFHGTSPESIMASVRSMFRIRTTSSDSQNLHFGSSNGFSVIAAPNTISTRNAESISLEEGFHSRPSDDQTKTFLSIETRPRG